MSNAWSHLPNAHHIDWVLKSVRKTPELWVAARDAAWDETWDAARAAAMSAAWDSAVSEARYEARDAARDAAMSAARSAPWFAVRDAAMSAAKAARNVISALVAYDDCDQFLSMSYEQLKVWAVLSEAPCAVLLLSMVYVKERLNEQCMVRLA